MLRDILQLYRLQALEVNTVKYTLSLKLTANRGNYKIKSEMYHFKTNKKLLC